MVLTMTLVGQCTGFVYSAGVGLIVPQRVFSRLLLLAHTIEWFVLVCRDSNVLPVLRTNT